MEKIQYKTEQEKEQIIEEKKQEGKILIEEQNLLNGNYLIFSDKPRQEEEIKKQYTKTEIKNIIKEYLKSAEGKNLIKEIKNE